MDLDSDRDRFIIFWEIHAPVVDSATIFRMFILELFK